MKADLSSEWLVLTVWSEDDLTVAFQLAYDLRGQPERQMWDPSKRSGIIVGGGVSKSAARLTHPFPFGAKLDAKELARFFWLTIAPSRPLRVNIPRYPIVGPDLFSVFMLSAHIICSIDASERVALDA